MNRATKIFIPVLLSLLFPLYGVVQAKNVDIVEGDNGKLLLFGQDGRDAAIRSSEIRDPFNWPDTMMDTYDFMHQETSALFADYTLSGIIYNPARPLAIINNTLLGEGDILDGTYVVAIEPDNVLLQQGTHQFVMEFEELIIEMTSEGVSPKKGSSANGTK